MTLTTAESLVEIGINISVSEWYGEMEKHLAICQWSGKPGFNPRSSHTKDSKMVLDASLLNTQHHKEWIKGKVKQSGERSSALPYILV